MLYATQEAYLRLRLRLGSVLRVDLSGLCIYDRVVTVRMLLHFVRHTYTGQLIHILRNKLSDPITEVL